MVSIDEVAHLAGVSTATVSRALSGRGHVSAMTRERVAAAAKHLGYVVSASASSLATGRTRNIGVLVPFLDRWFFSTVLSGVAAALARAGFDITLYSLTADAGERREIFETFLRRQRVDGVIAISIELGAEESAELVQLGIPLIGLGGPNPSFPSLTVDDVAVARLATSHLIGLGHRSIAHIGANPEFDRDFHIPTHRRRGFELALAEAGMPARPELYEPADFTLDGGFRAAKQLLGRPGAHPTAIFAASDEMAIGAVLAARELGFRVPEDLSIVGIDGHELGEFFRLTTVDQFPQGQGERAAETMLAQLEGGADAAVPASAADLPYELVVRGTTARARP
ncbi:LacI family DNA-binding transcriptional regulator [Microbacterium limosum]|uniref:LacI family DNA-binding transcriptional regulator n=1 Tax=Microbacterium limosum TaxID=3079935 RepID=A0AAU0MGX8_9MICO|nr:LacI family DNA-binding transcriptional regulator [Microbacterium sp. Y20]WOQ69743.1 LacI family DNA-binding transcriptional regulator [Microbacterium sp. Y20]